MKYDLLIFDLDGTLVDSADDIAESLQETYREIGRTVPERETIVAAIGNGVRTLIERTTPPPHEGLLERFLPVYERNCLRKSRLYPGVPETLAALPGRKTILSNKPEGLCRKIVHELGIEPYFQEIFGGDSFPVRKPDARIIRDLLVKVPGKRPILIGDSGVDVQTAINAGIPVVAVSYGYHKPGDLDPASFHVESFSQLTELFGRPS